MIFVKKQSYISEKGRRENNEDNGGYNPGGSFVVCDGVGGSEKGEIASEIVVRRFLEDYKYKTSDSAEAVLLRAEDDLSAHIRVYPETMGMATTLTFSQIREDGVYVAWVGDSRIYQFRQGKIVFVTTDHSWVNEALKAGILKPEEAINHPKSNIITRAVQGSHKAAQIDDVLLTDVQKGDLFLHCSDGVLEAWVDDALAELFATMNEPDLILQKIQEQCAISSRDNYTAIIYRIEDSNLTKVKEVPVYDAIPVEDEPENVLVKAPDGTTKKTSFFKKWFFTIALLLLASFAVLFFLNPLKKDTGKKAVQTALNTDKKQPVTTVDNKKAIQKVQKTLTFSAKLDERDLFVEIDLSVAEKSRANFYFADKKEEKTVLGIKKDKEIYRLEGKIDEKALLLELKGPEFDKLNAKYDQKEINFKKAEQ